MRRVFVVDANTKLVRVGGRPTHVVLVLLVAQLGLFLLYAFSDGPAWVKQTLVLNARRAFEQGALWQPLTALLLHLDVRTLVVDLLTLWIFGSALQRWWSGKRLLVFWLVSGAVGLLVGALVAWRVAPAAFLHGSTGAALGMTVAFTIVFFDHHVFLYGVLPLRAGPLGLIMLGFVLLGQLLSTQWLDLAVGLGGAAVALLFVLRPRRYLAELRLRRAKRRFGVVEGGKAKPDKTRYLN